MLKTTNVQNVLEPVAIVKAAVKKKKWVQYANEHNHLQPLKHRPILITP